MTWKQYPNFTKVDKGKGSSFFVMANILNLCILYIINVSFQKEQFEILKETLVINKQTRLTL